MKSLFKFLFSYGGLGWKSRLSQPDHLYHQGRAAIAMVLVSLPIGLAVITAGYLIMDSYPVRPSLAELPPAVIALAAFTLLMIGFALYLSFISIKLTVLRLHDFNRSGWWLLAYLPFVVTDIVLELAFPGVGTFFTTGSIIYLALLLWPGSSAPNSYGSVTTNSTAGKSGIVRAIPLVLFFGGWLFGMFMAFLGLYAQPDAPTTVREQEQPFILNEPPISPAESTSPAPITY